MAPFVVILDSCVIFPMPLCDTLLSAAEKGLFRPHFSQEILDGATRNLVKRGKMAPEKEQRFQSFIVNAFPDALLEIPQSLVMLMKNHPGDRHVLAAAVVAKADRVITANLKHFPPDSLEPWGIEIQHPDMFLIDLCDFYGDALIYSLLQEQARKLKSPPQTVLDLLQRFEKEQPSFASRMLLFGYGKVIRTTALRILEIFFSKAEHGNRSKSGVNYEILKNGERLIVRDKQTNCEILSGDRHSMTGQPLHRHVIAFEEMKLEIEKWRDAYCISQKVHESSTTPFLR